MDIIKESLELQKSVASDLTKTDGDLKKLIERAYGADIRPISDNKESDRQSSTKV